MPHKTVLPLLTCVLCLAAIRTGKTNENFVVNAPDETMSREILLEAERLRCALSREWLSGELPPGVGTTAIFVAYATTPGVRVSVPESPKRLSSVIWLDVDQSGISPGQLKPAIAQAIIATRYPGKLPTWIVNGIGAQYEAETRRCEYRRIVGWFRDTENWPEISDVLDADYLLGKDLSSRAIAYSLTEYLLSRRDRHAFLQFGQAGKQDGWEEALQSAYGIPNVEALEASWRQWVERDSPVQQVNDRSHLQEPLYRTAASPRSGASKLERER